MQPLLAIFTGIFTATLGGGFACMRIERLPIDAARTLFVVAATALTLAGVTCAEFTLPNSPTRYALSGATGALAAVGLTWLWSLTAAHYAKLPEAAAVAPSQHPAVTGFVKLTEMIKAHPDVEQAWVGKINERGELSTLSVMRRVPPRT
jgi:hypothetical protein